MVIHHVRQEKGSATEATQKIAAFVTKDQTVMSTNARGQCVCVNVEFSSRVTPATRSGTSQASDDIEQ